MVRGGKVGCKRNFNRRVRSKDKGSDDSDEDYVVSNEENEFSDGWDGDYCSSVDGNASEESFGSFVKDEEEEEETYKEDEDDDEEYDEGEEEEEEEEVRRVVEPKVRSKAQKVNLSHQKGGPKIVRKRGRIIYDEDEEYDEGEEEEEEVRRVAEPMVRSKAQKVNSSHQKVGEKTARKRRRFIYDDDDDDEYDEGEEEEEDVEEVRKVVESKVSSKVQNVNSSHQKGGVKTARKRRRVIYDDDKDGDEDYEVEEEEEEEEEEDDDFMLDEEEELGGRKKKNNMKVGKRGWQEKSSLRGQKGKRKAKVFKKPLRKKRRKNGGLRRQVQYENGCNGGIEFVNNRSIVREKSKKNPGPKKRRYIARSDSDFVSSGSSDYDYTISEEEKHTISEEERQQVREARKFCGNLRSSLRSSSFPCGIQEVGDFHQQRKPQLGKGKEKLEEPLGKKGKEKVEEVRTELGKQVCGICLSEEDNRRAKGTLDCCSHYFCFACIMEWAKVESRCPVCKQRFKTISKPARSTAGVDLREVLIPVPERDQVYQPSEEEVRSYLDPYENVICTECHEGGDDGLMLLCDVCDSPAHTYCVGLGREVPEGNWYCDGCRPVALASSSSQVQDHMPDQRTRSNNMSNRPPQFVNVREGLDLNLLSSPLTPFAQGFGNLSSPKLPVGDSRAASPVSGAGAPTLSGRRWIHRQIQQLISFNRMNSMAGRTDGTPVANSRDFSSSHSNQDRDRDTTTQHTRAQEMGSSYHTFFEDRLQDSPSPSFQNRDFFSSRLSFLRRQSAQDQTNMTTERSSLNGTLWPEPSGMDPIRGYEQLQCNRSSNIGSDGSLSPYTVREGIELHTAKEQVQSMVRKHLKNLSQDIDLGHSTFKDIARSSTHTIVAACGIEHRRSEVHCPVPPPSVCSHIELMAGGQTSLMKGCCSSCFESFVGDVVKRIMDTKMPPWLSLGL
ncbi:hypothetical protein I3843_07G025900 [Carya illinoinensis]|nr:hypothetical protein I3843_07G025900 [Carya illinoinensis]